MAAKFAEIFIKLGLKKEGFDKEVKQTSASFKDLGKDLLKFGAVAAGVTAGVVMTGKAIWSMAKQGAAIIQTGESFEFLLEKVGAAPDLLDQLTEATLGTVDAGTLMESTLTLTAGAGDDLTKMMMEAAPQLAKIAKAANKLNPALGDTAFMYQSIGTGVKRAQPLILDNLGLTIKVGDANEKFAASIGKTVEELTAEEKSMAILNATLAAGDTLIAQVGGSVEAAGDEMARAEAKISNMTGELKTRLVPIVADAADKFMDFVNNMDAGNEVLDRLIDAEARGVISKEEYLELLDKVKEGLITYEEATRHLIEAEEDHRKTTEGLSTAVHDVSWAHLENTEAIKKYAEATGWAAGQDSELITEKEKLIAVTKAQKRAQEELMQEMSDLKLFISGPLGKEYKSFKEKQADLSEEIVNTKNRIRELKAEGEGMTDEQVEELGEMQDKLIELSVEFKENADAHDEATKRIMFNLLSQRAAMDGLTAQEMDQLNKIALQWGLVDQATFDYVTNADKYFKILEDDTIETMGIVRWELEETMGIMSETSGATQLIIDKFGTLRSTLEGLSGTYDIKIRQFYERYGEPATGPQDFGGTIYGPDFQHGGSFIVPSGYEKYGFPMQVHSGEHVQVTPRGKRGGGNTFSYVRYGDQNFIQNSAAAAFLVEKQHQAEFDEIDKVI